MDVSKQIIKLFTLPFLILFIFVMMNFIGGNSPSNSVFIDTYFGRDYINVTETWIIPVLENENIFRIIPFENIKINSVSCSGNAFISYDGKYKVRCEGEFSNEATLSLEYTIINPYVCYDDLCFFMSSFFENTDVDTIEFTSVNAKTFTFPDLVEGISSSVSSFNVIASLPLYFKGRAIEGNFEKTFLQLGNQLSLFTKFENNYFINFVRIVSLEIFIVFVIFLLSKFQKIKRKNFESLSVKRTPFELFKLFFDSLDKNAVIGASILDLARKDLIEITSRHIKILKKKPETNFDENLLNFLSLLSEKNSIFLDEEWLKDRTNRIGKEKLKELIINLKQTPLSYKVQKEMCKHTFKGIVIGIEFGLFIVSLLMFLFVPTYLVKFRISMLLFGILNFFWIFFTRKSKIFLAYSNKGINEKIEIVSLLRLVKSKAQMKTAKNLDWTYLLVFSAMHDLEMEVIKIAEEKNKKFNKIKSPHLVLGIMHSFIRDLDV